MDLSVQEKIDATLSEIRDPQSGVSLLEMGLVERIRYAQDQGRLTVVLNRLGRGKTCCSVLSLGMLADFESAMKKGLQERFPGCEIRFVDAAALKPEDRV